MLLAPKLPLAMAVFEVAIFTNLTFTFFFVYKTMCVVTIGIESVKTSKINLNIK